MMMMMSVVSFLVRFGVAQVSLTSLLLVLSLEFAFFFVVEINALVVFVVGKFFLVFVLFKVSRTTPAAPLVRVFVLAVAAVWPKLKAVSIFFFSVVFVVFGFCLCWRLAAGQRMRRAMGSERTLYVNKPTSGGRKVIDHDRREFLLWRSTLVVVVVILGRRLCDDCGEL